MSRFDKYMAVPFQHGGRSFLGADCYGLYSLVLAEEAGLAMPVKAERYDVDPRAVAAAVSAALARGEWLRVAGEPRQFDAAVMTGIHGLGRGALRAELHVGCVIEGRKILHTEEHTGPRIVDVDDVEIKSRIRYFCRPAALYERSAA